MPLPVRYRPAAADLSYYPAGLGLLMSRGGMILSALVQRLVRAASVHEALGLTVQADTGRTLYPNRGLIATARLRT
jgi:hypothetical protein